MQMWLRVELSILSEVAVSKNQVYIPLLYKIIFAFHVLMKLVRKETQKMRLTMPDRS